MADLDARTWETDLSLRLRAAREKSTKSVEDVARAARQYGVLLHGDDIVKIESGARELRLAEALVLAKLMDVAMPVVTSPARDEWITATYVQKQRDLSREFAKSLSELKIGKKRVDELSVRLAAVRSAYDHEIAIEGGSPDPGLEHSLQSLSEQVDVVERLFREADQRLDGVLSRPSEPARTPGSQ